MCWDNDRQQPTDSQKFSNSNYMTSGNTEPMRIMSVADRPSCLESNQMNMTELSSCRGNPLPNVTNNELQNSEDNQKSLEKVTGNIVNSLPIENYSNSIPSTAHHNPIINQQPDQQQNGYLEMDRWTNLQQPKLITAAPTAYIPQPQQQPMQIHHTTNIVANAVVTHQPQQLLVMQQPAQPISYFPNFSTVATVQHTQPQWNSMGMSTMNIMDNNCQQNMVCVQNPINERQVFVPNIEEELDFLQQPGIPGGAINSLQQAFNPDSRRNFCNDPSTGFMTSYLKFLNGGKDTSPPPSMRGKV